MAIDQFPRLPCFVNQYSRRAGQILGVVISKWLISGAVLMAPFDGNARHKNGDAEEETPINSVNGDPQPRKGECEESICVVLASQQRHALQDGPRYAHRRHFCESEEHTSCEFLAAPAHQLGRVKRPLPIFNEQAST